MTQIFEANMKQLDELVAKLERGEMGLEESLVAYEKGMALVKVCEGQLAAADGRVSKIVGADGAVELWEA
ncbi:MAG: exodeoxyribonuclease VII small subunit [Alphaproteobacteria bacterium]